VPVEEKKNTLWPHRSLLRQRYRAAYDITDSLDEGQHALAIFLDVAKAFDNLNHSLLLSRLISRGFQRKLLNFLHLTFPGDDYIVFLSLVISVPKLFRLIVECLRAHSLGLFYFFFL
jgi:hypothetical protein